MINSFLMLFFLSQVQAAPGVISGEVTVTAASEIKPGGVLFVFAKEPGKTMPVAVLRAANPKFPFKFSLSEKEAMVPGTPFKGPFTITARYAPSGDAMDKSGPQSDESKPVHVGRTDVKIEMKSRIK